MSEPVEGADHGPGLDGLRRIAQDRIVGCGWRADEHRSSRRAWQAIGYLLALVAGIASALVATDLFGTDEGPFVSAAPYLAAVAAVAVVVNTALDAQRKAAAHEAARAGFEDLVVMFRRWHESTVNEEPCADAKRHSA